VEALSKEKEKKTVLIDLELVNLKSASLLNYEELKRRTIKVEKKKLMEANNIKGIYNKCKNTWRLQMSRKKFGPNWCGKKVRGL
jgi:hypothetical protein